MVHGVGGQVKTDPGDLERHLAAELSRKGMARHETVPIMALWLRNIGGKAQVLAEINGNPRRWFLVMEESLDSAFSHIAEVGGILDSPEDPLTCKPE